MALKPILLVNSAGALVGHHDDLAAGQALADDIALASDLVVKVYREVSAHAPRVFSPLEEAEKTAEGAIIVDTKRARAKVSAKSAGEEVAAALAPPSTVAATPRADREKALKALPADEVRTIAASHGVEASTKAENIENILGVEFP
jgi:hypothetical protein